MASSPANPQRLRIATRGSDLALWQARFVAERLDQIAGLTTELVVISTQGDRRQDLALGDPGSIGLFTSEVQQALLQGEADLAVHSLKDLPAQSIPGLQRAAVPQRADPRDFLLIHPQAFAPGAPSLPVKPNSRIGTSAARRKALLLDARPDVEAAPIRGNVPTRLQKLARGDYDAILLAAAGVQRLGLDLSAWECHPLPLQEWPGAPGQGALAVECRSQDRELSQALSAIHLPEVAEQVDLERALLQRLGGGCSLPLGAYAERVDGHMHLWASLGSMAEEPARPLRRAHVQNLKAEALVDAAFQQLRNPEKAG